MTDTSTNQAAAEDAFAEHLSTPLTLFITDRLLRGQLRNILSVLKFTDIAVRETSPNFLENARQLCTTLIKMDPKGLVLVNAPLRIKDASGKVKVEKDWSDYFVNVKMLLTKARKEENTYLSRCVPVFSDIRFAQKRENTILSLVQFGIGAAFILKQHESLIGLSSKAREQRLKEQLMERFGEVRDYLADFLPSREGTLDRLMEKKEEMELSQRKAEAEQWMRKAETAKASRDLEKAVQCYTKAIDIYPADPMAYLDSGQVYVRLKKYPQAFQRFRQAEEVSQGIPKPNKEIANTRMLQIQERLDKGESPKSEAVAEMLDEVVEHFKTALEKAVDLKPLLSDETRSRNVEAVNAVAGDIFKLDLETVFGKQHPAVKTLRGLARDAILEVSKKSEDESLTGPQLICLGLAAVDDGDFDLAEEHLFKALSFELYMEDAAKEISYLGTLLRKREQPQRAIAVYERLLEHSPPNRAAVLYNLSVANMVVKKEESSAGSLVRAVYLDPWLPENDLFYKNAQIHDVIGFIKSTFARVVDNIKQIKPDPATLKAVKVQERLEILVGKGNDDAAFKLLWQITLKMPTFFKRESLHASHSVMEFIDLKEQELRTSNNANLIKFGKFLSAVLSRAKDVSDKLASYLGHRAGCLQVLESGGDQSEAAYHLAKGLAYYPRIIKSPDFYANQDILNLAREINTKLARIDLSRIAR